MPRLTPAQVRAANQAAASGQLNYRPGAPGTPAQVAGVPPPPTRPMQALQPWQRQQLQKATAAGTQAQFLASHPGVQQHITKLQGGTPQQQTRANTLLGTPAAPAAPTAPAPAQGAPTTAAPKSGGGAAPPPATTPPPAPPPAPPTFQGALTNQYGQGQPFGLQSWYGDNPIQTASDVANRELQKNLAGIRARYAGGGMGSSGREAIAEGTAAGEATTGLGDVLASRGIGARAQDVSTALNAFLGAGQQQLQGQANQMQYSQNLASLGNAINQIGALEQGIPNAGLIEQLLGLFSQSTGTGKTSTKQKTAGGFLGM